ADPSGVERALPAGSLQRNLLGQTREVVIRRYLQDIHITKEINMKCSLRTAIQQTLLAAAGVSLLAQAAVAAPTIAAKVKIEEGGIYQIVHNEETDSVYVAVTGGEGTVVVLDD